MELQINSISKRYFLVGMMGSGKSYWAEQISRESGIPALDTDQLIASHYNQSITEIFEKEGEVQFRTYEKELLENYEWPSNAIVSTGGGLPCYHGNMETLLQLGKVIFLDPPIEILVDRLWEERAKRPMVSACNTREELQERIGNLLLQRRAFYKKATIRLRMSNLELSDWKFFLTK